MAAGLARIGRSPRDIRRIVVSHGHVDRYGGARTLLEQAGSEVLVEAHPRDIPKMAEGYPRWADTMPLYAAFFARLGVPPETMAEAAREVGGGFTLARRIPRVEPIDLARPLRLAHATFEPMHMPGHTPGLVCLYDREHRLFLSDDHLLEHVSPNPLIELGPEGEEGWRPLVAYLESVARLRALEVDLVLPGHSTPFAGHREVIDGLLGFYRKRQERIRARLEGGGDRLGAAPAPSFRRRLPGPPSSPSPRSWRTSRSSGAPRGGARPRGRAVPLPPLLARPSTRRAGFWQDPGMPSIWVQPETWASLATLAAMEIVLGLDNVVFLTILVGRLPPARRPLARRLGLLAALATRLALLFAISWLMGLTADLFTLLGQGVSARDLILAAGGLFLVAKATVEIHDRLEVRHERQARSGRASFAAVLLQIAVLDVVFSLDSVITAVGMASHLEVMVAAMVVAVGAMLAFAGVVARFVERHPSVKMLALSFLILIGVMLVAEAIERHIPRGYIYFAMAFSLGVEVLNIRARRANEAPVRLHSAYEGDPEARRAVHEQLKLDFSRRGFPAARGSARRFAPWPTWRSSP